MNYAIINADTRTCQTWNTRDLSGELILPADPYLKFIEPYVHYETYSLVGIGERSLAFNQITSVDIPNSVTYIDKEAFEYCTSLTSVTFGNSVVLISTSAFNGCSALPSVTFGNSVKMIAERAFYGCSALSSVTFGNSVKTIGERAFQGCTALSSVIVPPSVESIGEYAFYDTKKVAYPIGAGIRLGADKNISYDPETAIIEDGWVYGPAKKEIIFAPTDIEGEYLFPDSVVRVGSGAFFACDKITSIKAPAKVPEIQLDSFKGLYESVELVIPAESVVAYLASPWNQFKNIRVEGTDQNLETKTFTGENGLNYLLLPASEEGGENQAIVLSGEYSGDITVPDRFTDDSDMDNRVRYYVKGIGYKAFANNTDIQSVGFNNRINLTDIGQEAFANCTGLSEIIIPSTVKTIGAGAFKFDEQHNLGTIAIPASVTSVGADAFANAVSETVDITDLGAWCNIDFASAQSNPLCGSTNGISINGEAASSISVPETVTDIKQYAFYGCKNLDEIIVPTSVEHLGTGSIPAPTVTLLDGTEPLAVDKNALNGSNAGAVVNLYWGRHLPETAFDVSGLETLAVGNLTESIPDSVFAEAKVLKSVKLGSGLKSIGNDSFRGCAALTEIVIPPLVETIGESSFDGCTELDNIFIGHSVANIGANAFNATKATGVYITAQTPPFAPTNVFSSYAGTLYVHGEEAVDEYYDALTCWDHFDEATVMVEPTALTLDKTGINGMVGDKIQLSAALEPENVTLPHIFWHSTNPAVATVDHNGLVTLHSDAPAQVQKLRAANAADNDCKIIARSLYSTAPVAELTVNDDSSSTSISTIKANGDSPAEYYTLSGIRLPQVPAVAGIYIVRQGGICRKIVVK